MIKLAYIPPQRLARKSRGRWTLLKVPTRLKRAVALKRLDRFHPFRENRPNVLFTCPYCGEIQRLTIDDGCVYKRKTSKGTEWVYSPSENECGYFPCLRCVRCDDTIPLHLEDFSPKWMRERIKAGDYTILHCISWGVPKFTVHKHGLGNIFKLKPNKQLFSKRFLEKNERGS